MISALFCLFLGQGVLSYVHHINNASDLVNFSKNVSSGTNYNGTTVFLDADIDFSGGLSQQLEPIGEYWNSKYFRGAFDGRGHTINNLAMNSSSQYAGLFGYSNRTTIKNVVLDSSCSVVNSYSDYSYIGGIIGYCRDCTIENIVNMASVSFTGSIRHNNLFLGGITGCFYASNKDATMRNCANYGSVTHSGTTTSSAYIGGIIGSSEGASPKYVQNCLNYGAITHSGTTGSLNVGGIVGSASYGTISIENCVSSGKITSNKASDYIGSIVGYINSGSSTINITHCYWTSDVGYSKACGDGSSNIDTETKQVSLNATTINNLNSYSSSWAKWFMLYLNRGSINSLNQASLVVTQKHFPRPVKEGNTFLFWCLDTECNEKYDPNTTNITTVTGLYAVWTANNYTVTLNVNDGDALPESELTVTYGQPYNFLPNASRTGYTFIGWFTEENGGIEVTNETTANITADNHTLYAQWAINNYTLTFDFRNGIVDSKTFKYNETIVYPMSLTREGFAFNGWKPKPERMPANDTTAVAQWTVNTTEYVEIIFGKKDMTRENIQDVIKKYTDEEFTIEKFEEDKNTGETKVIIKFKDAEEAKNFVDAIKESSGVAITSINFLSDPLNSAASKISLLMIFGLMLL